MNDDDLDQEHPDEPNDPLLARIERLEAEHQTLRQISDQRIIVAETRLEALKAGMIDLDGIRLLDLAGIEPSSDGTISGIAERISDLKSRKPWLFSVASSSSIARAPASRPPRQKLATEMSAEEYRIARAKIISRRAE